VGQNSRFSEHDSASCPDGMAILHLINKEFYLRLFLLTKQYVIACAIGGGVEILNPLAKDYSKTLRPNIG